MSQTYAAKLDTEHSSVAFSHEFLTVLESRDLQPEIEELWSTGSIKPGEENSGHLLAVVSHLPQPLDQCDIADTDRRETYICGCKGWFFQCYDQEIGAKEDDCKHCEQVKRQRRGETDEKQETLV